MACCSEFNCRRRQPIVIALGPFSGLAYAITRGRLVNDNGDGSSTLQAQEKHDITETLRFFIHRNPEWVRAVLDERPVNAGNGQ